MDGKHNSMIKDAENLALPKVVAAIIVRGETVLAARRRPGGPFGGLWEFPGGKLEKDEEPENGLARELAEELGIESSVGELVCSVPFRGHGLMIELLAYTVDLQLGEFRLSDHAEVTWLAIADLDEMVFAEPDRPVVRLLKTRFAGRGERPA